MVKVKFTEPDAFGQKHPIETPELIKEALIELDSELATFPKGNSWEQAKTKCAPELVNDDHKLMFLRCEVFKVKMAAKRLLNYWNKRIELFGLERAFLAIVLRDEDKVPYERGGMQFLAGATDTTGRAVFYADPSKQDRTKYTHEEVLRALWYLVHVALADPRAPNVQTKGVILVSTTKRSNPTQFDPVLLKKCSVSVRGCLPLRISAMFVCHPPAFFRLVYPIIKVFLGPLQKRVFMQSGSDEKIVAALSNNGIPKESVPTHLGGDFHFDHMKWWEERKAIGM